MIHFFFALLAVAALVLAACVLWPLRTTAPRLFAGGVLCMPVLLLALYQITGTPAALMPGTAAAMGASPDDMPHSLDAAITQLEASLQQNPDQPEGWALLARSHAAQGNLTRARDAWTRALTLAPDEPIVLTEAAQAQAQADPQNRFDDDSLAWLERASALQPDNQRARWFIGVAQRQRGADAEAVATWEALLPLVDDASTAASLREQIDAARHAAGLPPSAPRPPAPQPAASTRPAADARSLTLSVSLSPALASGPNLDSNATVFVLARQPGGPPMPVAVTRLRLAELPATVTLDDSNSPMPTQPLSALDEVEVLARLSASGSAVRQDGDIDSAPVRIRLPHRDTIPLVIGDAR